MKKLLPLLTLLFLASGINAQNWNPLKPATTNYFTNIHGYLRAIQLDSITGYGTDLHYYPYRRLKISVNGVQYNSDTIGCWIGRHVISKPNGDYRFVNHWNDTVVVKAKANVGDSWTFLQHGNKQYTAEVVGADTMTILGNLDSVKRIELHAYENGNLLTADSFDGMELVLSKGHGFQKTTELYYFPFHEPDTTMVVSDYYFTRSLYPMDDYMNNIPQNPGKYKCTFELVQIPTPTPSQFVDWNVGDICQYNACFVSWVMGTGSCQPPYSYRLDTIVAKTITSSGVEYIRRGWKTVPVYGTSSTPLYHAFYTHQDTVFFPNTGQYFVDGNDTTGIGVPEKIVPTSGLIAGWHNYYFPADTTHCITAPAYYRRGFALWGLNAQMALYGHKQGLGNMASEWMWYDNIQMNGHDELIYSVRNGVACGSYVFPDTSAPVSVQLFSKENSVSVYPNPAQGELTVEASFPKYSIELVNSIGQSVFSRLGCRGRQQVALDMLSPGIYVLRLESSGGDVINRKLVLQ